MEMTALLHKNGVMKKEKQSKEPGSNKSLTNHSTRTGAMKPRQPVNSNVSPYGTHVLACFPFRLPHSASGCNARAYWLSAGHLCRSPFHAPCSPVLACGLLVFSFSVASFGGGIASSGFGRCTVFSGSGAG